MKNLKEKIKTFFRVKNTLNSGTDTDENLIFLVNALKQGKSNIAVNLIEKDPNLYKKFDNFKEDIFAGIIKSFKENRLHDAFLIYSFFELQTKEIPEDVRLCFKNYFYEKADLVEMMFMKYYYLPTKSYDFNFIDLRSNSLEKIRDNVKNGMYDSMDPFFLAPISIPRVFPEEICINSDIVKAVGHRIRNLFLENKTKNISVLTQYFRVSKNDLSNILNQT